MARYLPQYLNVMKTFSQQQHKTSFLDNSKEAPKMRILKIIHGYPPHYNAGSEVYTQSIVRELSKRHEIFVVSRIENPFERDFHVHKEEKANITFYFVNFPNSRDGYNIPAFNEVFHYILKEIQPEVVHIGHLNHLSTGIVPVIKRYQIPILYTLHDYWLMCPRGQFLQRNITKGKFYEHCDGQEDEKCADECYQMYFNSETDRQYYIHWVKRRMQHMKTIAKQIDLFHAPSKYLMHKFIYEFGIPKEKIFYLDYGFPTHYLKPVENKVRDVFTFGYIGRIIPAKGVHLLIQAFKKIQLPSKLIIWGRMNYQTKMAMENLAKGSYNPIVFAGEYQNDKIVQEVFQKINCLVVPSIWAENSPLVIHEAQACRIPVITANYGGMKEYVQHKVNGLLFEFRNLNDLYEKMLFAIKNPKTMIALGKRGYLYSPDGNVPSIEEHCRTLEVIYKKLLTTSKCLTT